MKNKRLLSLILTVVMVAAMLPVAFAVEADMGTIEYVFSYEAFDENNNIKNADIVSKTQDDMADGYNKWDIEGVSQVREGSAIQENALYLYGSTNRVINAETGTNDGTNTIAAAIVLDITETGTFNPKLTYTGRPNSPKYKVHFVKKKTGDDVSGWCNGSKHNTNNANLNAYIATLTDEEYLGEVEMYSQEVAENSSTELNTLNITETGLYYLILADNGINPAAGTVENVMTYINSFSLMPADKNEDVVNAFAIDNSKATVHNASIATTCATLDKNSITATNSADDEDGDGVYFITADEVDSTGEYTFLYWIKGMTSDKANKIVSFAREFNYKPQNGANYLIAVYEKKSAEATAKAEFYNGNGQLLDATLKEDGTLPALPSMAVYGKADHWALYGDTNKWYENDSVELSGTMIFVAQYNDVYVTVNNKSVRYGDEVTFTADSSIGEFKWWQRTANGVTEIVSVDKTYTFSPWEDCTVEGVYSDKKQIMAGKHSKIILDIFGTDGIMAEFIGLDGVEVVEKGIILDNKKVSMSSNSSQFTVTNDIQAQTASGYAIIKNEEGVIEINDGSLVLGN